MTPGQVLTCLCLLALGGLAGLWLTIGVVRLLKAGDRWRRTGRCGRTGRMRWATR